jgi:hypothetical protein
MKRHRTLKHSLLSFKDIAANVVVMSVAVVIVDVAAVVVATDNGFVVAVVVINSVVVPSFRLFKII